MCTEHTDTIARIDEGANMGRGTGGAGGEGRGRGSVDWEGDPGEAEGEADGVGEEPAEEGEEEEEEGGESGGDTDMRSTDGMESSALVETRGGREVGLSTGCICDCV